MSKARTLANLISDNAELADGQISVAEVVGAAPLASPTFTGVVGATTISSPTLNATINLKTTDANGEGIGLGIDADKKVRFYDDQGASTKMYWNASTATQKFEDSSKIAFGSSEDLEIYHDGSNSYITDNGTGNLRLKATSLRVQSASGNSYLNATNGGSVDIFYNNSQKLTTTSTGIDVTGKTTSDALDLTAIAKDISDTAVDVFVYDTSKDSDGGAWRKRTQNTSWYNETLNTATRGSRKEFPSVAVIVAESNQVTIYDGDDPDMPMWMVFNINGTNNFLLTGVRSITSINGKIALGNTGSYARLMLVDFLAEESYWITASSVTVKQQGIASRNSTTSNVNSSNYGTIDHATVNDVAMTVLPNAPVDAATGLPVPTIAVATDGGVSVIKDDGTVVDLTYTANATNESGSVNFTEGNGVAWTTRNIGGTYAYLQHLHTIPSSDYSSAPDNIYLRDVNAVPGYIGTYIGKLLSIPNGYAVSSPAALTIFDENKDLTSTGMNAYITPDYNTGWMNGDIKLATLSDTDDTNVTGAELVTNGTFASNTSGWTAINATLSVDAGRLKIVDDGSSAAATQTISVTAGETYVISFNATAGTASCQAYVSDGTFTVIGSTIPNGVFSYTYTAPSGVSSFVLGLNNTNGITGQYCFFDNVSVRLAEADRSVNGNGLQVFGTVTKTPVATGADLVAYGGFSSSNYLQQPYNSDLDFGTGDFCWMSWTKYSGTPSYIFFDRGNGTDSNNRLQIHVYTNNVFRVNLDATVLATPSASLTADVWNLCAVVRRNGVLYLYINGELQASGSATGSLSSTSLFSRVGLSHQGSTPLNNGSVSLSRISATAPSPEQIAKIYNDEKVLFQENAQATLYGSSDAVTALAYDDSTELLHVGTSAGRSVFQGLRRVDNTTTAVGAAISASNGLVAED